MPGSKSLTNRHLVLGALADGPTTVARPLRSRDTLLMLDALRRLGVRVEELEATWRLVPPAELHGDASVDCGLAGTVFRFLPPVAALARGPVDFDGDAQARSRPVAPLLGALRDLGVRVEDGDRGTLPFTVHGTGSVTGGALQVDASASSQFVSALLLAAPCFQRGLDLSHVGPRLPSLPHVRMTLQVLRDAGADARQVTADRWQVAPGPLAGREVEVEPDLSSAAPFLAAAAVTGGRVTVTGWPSSTTQPGDVLPDLLTGMGAHVTRDAAALTLEGPEPGTLRGLTADLHDVGELAPVLAAVAALATTPSELSGIAHLRGHETDRLDALATEITRLGGRVQQTDDGLAIEPQPLHAGAFGTYADHRMVMAGAVLGLLVPGLVVTEPGTVAKTFPRFVSSWQELVTP